jgi:hypothetical protein
MASLKWEQGRKEIRGRRIAMKVQSGLKAGQSTAAVLD